MSQMFEWRTIVKGDESDDFDHDGGVCVTTALRESQNLAKVRGWVPEFPVLRF